MYFKEDVLSQQMLKIVLHSFTLLFYSVVNILNYCICSAAGARFPPQGENDPIGAEPVKCRYRLKARLLVTSFGFRL